jgi:putative ABC transport system permease protein
VGAHWAIKALVAGAPGGLPAFGAIGLDLRVLLFSAGITIVSGILFGAVPALYTARRDLTRALTQRAGDATTGGGIDLRNTFVAIQLALCIVLLVGAGLLTRSLVALQRVRPGFDPEHLLTAEFRLPAAKYATAEQITAFMGQAIINVRAVGGVKLAALVRSVPLSGNWGRSTYVSDVHPEVEAAAAPVTQQNTVTDGFFRTMGIPLLEGRDFDDRDRADGVQVAIVNRTLARHTWPGQSALGRRLKLIGPPEVWVTVVGVVGDIKQLTLGEPADDQLYQPLAQAAGIFSSLVVRTAGDPVALGTAVRAAIWAVDPQQPVWKIRSMESLVTRDVSGPKFTMLLTAAFALLALVLASVGVYGVMSYAMGQRTREVGIRMALGAQPGAVIRMLLGRGLRVVAVATALGLPASFWAARLLKTQLFDVPVTDPVTFVTVPVLLAFVAVSACFIPARRAARVDPVIALRSE